METYLSLFKLIYKEETVRFPLKEMAQ